MVEDNIWDVINPIEGLSGEGATAGITATRVPASDQVTTDNNWNPWVPEQPAPEKPDVPSNPGSGSGSGGSSSGDDSSDTLYVNGGNVSMSGTETEGLKHLIVNSKTPDLQAYIVLDDVNATDFSVRDSSYHSTISGIDINGSLENITYTAQLPSNVESTNQPGMPSIGSFLRSNATGTATVIGQTGINLTGEYHLGQAKNVELQVEGTCGDIGPLSILANEAENVTFATKSQSYVSITALNADVSGTVGKSVDSMYNAVLADGKTVTIDGNSGNDSFHISVRDSATLNGDGGHDLFIISAVDPNLENGKQAEMIKVNINGVHGGYESYKILTSSIQNAMVVEINGCDIEDYLEVGNATDGNAFISMNEEVAKLQMNKFFGQTSLDNFTALMRDNLIMGYYDPKNYITYGFSTNGRNEIVAGIKLNNIATAEQAQLILNNAQQAFGDDSEYIELEKGKLDYSMATYPDGSPMSTWFSGIVGLGADSTLVSGVKIPGDSRAKDCRLIVSAYGDFDGLGDNGFVKDVTWLQLANMANKFITFNAENMDGFDLITIQDGPMAIKNLSTSGDMRFTLHNIQQSNAVTEFELIDGSVPIQKCNMTFILDNVGTADNPLILQMNAIENARFEADPYYGHNGYIDISSITTLKDLFFGFNAALDLTGKSFHALQKGDEIIFTVSEGDNLDLSILAFNDINTVNINAYGQIGNSGEITEWLALGTDNVDNVNIKTYEDAYFYLTTKKADIKLSGENSSLMIDADTINITGGSGNEYIIAGIFKSAVINGGGGSDQLWVHPADLGDGVMQDAKLIGCVSSESETFGIVTHDMQRTSLRLVIEGFDISDKLLIGNNNPTQFATFENNEAGMEQMLRFFDIEPNSSLMAITNINGTISGYYDSSAQTAYAFAPNATNNIGAGVQLNEVSFDLAAQAFGIDVA